MVTGPSGDAAAGASPDPEREVMRRLWRIYSDTVLPLERASHFEHFHSPPITAEEFICRPQVMLLGQYSTGKTTMTKWFTGVNSPHFDIRPQPSTDKFMAVVHGHEEKSIQGNAATCLPQMPYQGLATFGGAFLNNFQALVLPADILQKITFIDTPGVLSGCKQRTDRNYDFSAVCAWLVERVDLVLLTFDAHKLDISDELQAVMEVLRPHADKVRCVLNKADQIDANNLVRVYGALLWNIGKVWHTPEIAKVFVSSFWDTEYRYKDHQQLFDEDKEAVIKELHALPRTALLRKVNSFVNRVRSVRAHLCIVACIRSKLPWLPLGMCGGEHRFRVWLRGNYPQLAREAQRLGGVSPGDMPDAGAFCRHLETFESLSSLPSWSNRDLERLSQVIKADVPKLLEEVSGVTTPDVSLAEPEAHGVSRFLGRLGLGERGGGKRKREDGQDDPAVKLAARPRI
mmetsp:Transcript_48634/g.137491  ORF Transcript_48634/g.137491 Transcript_48634/m.137491 type:complete len:458 (+) Transcript_48634:50-1423(+)